MNVTYNALEVFIAMYVTYSALEVFIPNVRYL